MPGGLRNIAPLVCCRTDEAFLDCANKLWGLPQSRSLPVCAWRRDSQYLQSVNQAAFVIVIWLCEKLLGEHLKDSFARTIYVLSVSNFTA